MKYENEVKMLVVNIWKNVKKAGFENNEIHLCILVTSQLIRFS